MAGLFMAQLVYPPPSTSAVTVNPFAAISTHWMGRRMRTLALVEGQVA